MRVLRAFGLPSLLLVLVVITHYSYALIASFYDPLHQLAASKAWHSVLRGGEALALYLTVWALVPRKPAAVRAGAAVACAWGAAEQAMIVGCRVVFPMDRPPPETALYSGMCDKATGLPVYMLALLAVFLIVTLRESNGPAA